MKKIISFVIVTVMLLAGIAFFAFKLSSGTTEASAEVLHYDGATAGNSLLDVRIPAGVKNVRLPHTAYISYFNTKHRIPNCVIYELTATQVAQCDAPGAEKRKNYQFNADPMCSASPQWSDYKHSGYDRGHMAPANDMKWSKTSMEESFYMTNICPQLHALNDGCWRKLELAIHRWAKRDKRLIIAAGPVLKNVMLTIGPDRNISVPAAFYKVVYAPNQGRAIGFIFNNEKISGGYASHAVSVDYVERVTGIDFFCALDDALENKIEAHSSIDMWK